MIDFPAALLQILLGLLLLSFYHPFFIAYGILLLLLIYAVFKLTAKKGLETSLEESKHKYRVAHWIQEVARSIVSFKLSGKTSLAVDKNDHLVTRYLKARESHFRVLVLQFIQMIGFKVLVTAGLLIIGGLLVLNQQMNIGQFVAAEIIILLVITSVEKLILGLESAYDLLTSLEKLGQVVDKELEPLEGETPLDESETLDVELREITYHSADEQKTIIDHFSVQIPPGSRIVIKGPSGSGKTTLLRLITGILRPDSGQIFANGISLDSMLLNHYRSQLGQCLPEETPFEGTLLENLTFGNPNIPMEEVYRALEQIRLLSFVKALPQGLKTVIYPEGRQFPYVVARKIVLARSILNRPKLLALKDPLDQFEPGEASEIMDFLTDNDNPWSLVVVSSNDRWEEQCARVLEMDSGRLIKDSGPC